LNCKRRKSDTVRFMGMGGKPVCPVHEFSVFNDGVVCYLHGYVHHSRLERQVKHRKDVKLHDLSISQEEAQHYYLEMLKYESMVERREDKIKKLKERLALRDPNDFQKFRCWHCNSELIWGGDHDIQEVLYDESREGIASNFSCSNYDCHTHVEVYCFETPDE